MTEEFSHKILIVDDEKSVGKSLGRIFMAEDIDFIYAESGNAAINEIKSAKKPFSIIISDQRMPGMQGIELLEQIKGIHPDSFRFLLTAHSDMDIIIKSVNKGAIHKFINKPWDNNELLELIKTYFKHYEKVFEHELLLKTAKKQNQQLYKLDLKFIQDVEMQNKKLADLNQESKKLEQQISNESSSSPNDFSQIAAQMQKIIINESKPDMELIDKFYTYCINNLYEEFEDIANKNGFEMPQVMKGDLDE